MRKNRCCLYRSVGIVCICLLLCNCGGISPRRISFDSATPLTRPEKILQNLLSENSDIRAIKGRGQVKLTQNNLTNSFLAYWMGKTPDQLRIEVRAVSGQALLSFASDGKRIYIYSYAEDRLYRKKASKGTMARIVSVEMTPEDFMDLLSGRIPVHQDGDVRMEQREGEGSLLIVDGRGRDYTDIISLDESGSGIREFQRREGDGQLIFRASFEGNMEEDGHHLPGIIALSNDKGASIDIRIEKCWINPEIDAEQFVLESP